MMLKSILVTGGAGYIGSHIARYLSLNGWQVIVLDNLLHGQKFTHEWAMFVKGDINNSRLLNQLFTQHKIQYVVHSAIATHIDQSLTDPLLTYRNNIGGSIALLDNMHKHNTKGLIFLSSIAIHGKPLVLPIQENHPINPLTPYAQSLSHIEQIIRDAHQAYKLPYVILRPTNAAGAIAQHNLYESHNPETHLIPRLLHAMHTEKPLYIYGNTHATPDGSSVRDFLHVWDIADATHRAIIHLDKQLTSETFVLGTGTTYSVKQIITQAEQLYKKPIRTLIAPARAHEPPILVVDPTHAYTVLGWRPIYSQIPFILQSTYAALNQQKETKQYPLLNYL